MRPVTRRIISLPLLATLSLAACGGSDDASTPADDAPAADAPPTGETGETDDAPAEGSTDDTSDADAGSGVSGGPIADDWSRVCELADAQTIADLFGVEAVAQVNGAGGGTGRCEYGANAEVSLTVTSSVEQLSMSADDAFAMRVSFERNDNGEEVAEAPLMNLPRATWIEEGGEAVTIVALEPYIVEMRDAAGQDIVIGIAIGGVLDALR